MDYDKKILISNIKAIRDYNKLTNKELADDLYLTKPNLEKYLSGERPIPEVIIQDIAKFGGFGVEELKYQDLSKLLKNDTGTLDDNINYSEMSEDFSEYLNEYFQKCYPIIYNKTTDSINFAKGIEIYEKDIKVLFSNEEFNNQVLLDAINYFIKAWKEGVVEAAVNVLSCYGYYWGLMGSISMKKDFNVNLKIDSIWEYFRHSNDGINQNLLEDNRKLFLDGNNSNLTFFMKRVRESKYSDYAYYFLAIRYLTGMLDSEITKLSMLEERKFGVSLLDCLSKMGNKYAKEFYDYINDLEEDTTE